MKKLIKCISVILVIFLIAQLLPFSVIAAEYTEETARKEYLQDTLSDYLYDLIDSKDITEVLTPETDEEPEEAAASALNLKTENGENVTYLFSEPIAFYDENGELKYKEINIEAQPDAALLQEGYAYTNGTNDYRISFSENASKGLKIDVDSVSWKLSPILEDDTSLGYVDSEQIDNKAVDVFVYPQAFGKSTEARYYPQMNGVKEDIILSAFEGNNVFSFSLQIENGYAVLNEDHTVSIHNAETGEIADTFTPPYAFDSLTEEDGDSPAKHYVDCVYGLLETSAGNYTLSVTVPEDFLAADTTVYPVVIDPTTSSVYQSVDTPVYSGYPTSSFASYPQNCIGRASDYGYGRVLTKFTVPAAIQNYATISSAYLWVRETTGRTTTTYVRPYMNTTAFTASTTWNTKPSYDTNVSMPSKNINSDSQDGGPSEYWYKFDIKNAVTEWTTGTANNGLTFISDAESNGEYYWRAFASAEHGTSSYHPYAVITYTNDTTKPVISSVTGNPSSWTTGSVTLTVNATDNASGVAYYSFDNGGTWQTGKTKTFSSNQTVVVKVKDRAGNISNATTVNISRIMKRPYAYVSGDLLEIVMFEGADDIQRLEYNLNGGSWQTYTAPVRIVCTGDTQIQYRAVYSDTSYYSGTAVTMRANVGVYKTQKDDLRNGSFMLPSGFVRTYNSSTKEWFFAFNANIQSLNGGKALKYTDFNGEITHFIRNGDTSNYYSQTHAKITQKSGSLTVGNQSVSYFYILKQDNVTLYFNTSGKLAAVVEGDQRVRIVWSSSSVVLFDNYGRIYTVALSSGKPTSITDCANHTVAYTWTSGRLTGVVNALNDSESYAYDTAGRLTTNGTETVSYTSDGRTAQITKQNGSYLKYVYNDGSMYLSWLFLDMVYKYGTVQVSDSRGLYTSIKYADGFVVGESLNESADGMNYANAVSSVPQAASDLTGTAYTNKKLMGSIFNFLYVNDGPVQLLDDSHYIYYNYDANDNPIGAAIVALEEDDIIASSYSEALLKADERIINTYSNGCLTESIWQEKENNVWQNLTKETYTYTTLKQISSYSIFEYINSAWEWVTFETYTYDAYGNMSSTTTYEPPENLTDYVAVDPSASAKIMVSDSQKTYDILGRVLSEDISDEGVQSHNSYIYDVLGRTLVETIDSDVTQYTYDSDDNVLTQTRGSDVNTFTYMNGNLTSCSDASGNTICYTYDTYGNLQSQSFDIYSLSYNTLGSLTSAKVNASEAVGYEYSGISQDLTKAEYENGQNIFYTYDNGRIASVSLGSTLKYSYNYTLDSEGNVTQTVVTDAASGLTKTLNETITSVSADGNTLYSIENHRFDENDSGSFDGKIYSIGNTIYTLVTEENCDTITHAGSTIVKNNSYNSDYNLVSSGIENAFTLAYAYNVDRRVASMNYTLHGATRSFSYSYDTYGNILTETTSAGINQYTYDANSQLVTAQHSNTKWVYTYDNRGNITSKKKYAVNNGSQTLVSTDTFTYGNSGWQDELTVFNGQSITYDASGNPSSYRGHALTWTMGRQLAGFDGIAYTYNEDGIRTSKTANGVTTSYYLDGTDIISQTDGINTIFYLYDSAGEIIGLTYSGADYFYIKNQMDDVTGIVDASGNLVAEYAYDPWGAVLSVSGSNTALANANPFRYRSYYYDSDIGMYYLQSRYYDPEICRFINADQTDNIFQEQNSYRYCFNNPTNCSDFNGKYPVSYVRFFSALKQLFLIVSKVKNRIVMIVYDREGSDFIEQAKWMKKQCKDQDVETYYFTKKEDFVKLWNSKTDLSSEVFLFMHGVAGQLCFPADNMDCDDIKDEMSEINVATKVHLLSCNGGTEINHKSVAGTLAELTIGTPVNAVVNGSVYYKSWYQPISLRPLTKEKGAYWADFIYTDGKLQVEKKINLLKTWSRD